MAEQLLVFQSIHKLDAESRGMTARSIIQALFPTRDRAAYPKDGHEAAREAIESITRTAAGRQPDAVLFGKYLAKSRGRVVHGLRLESVALPSDHTIHWTIRKAD